MLSEYSAEELLRRIHQWGVDRNIIGDATSRNQLPKLMEELGEMAGGIARKHKDTIKDGIGDVIVVLSMIAGIEGLTIHECIDQAYNEIKDRKGVLLDGTFIKSTDDRYGDAVVEIDRRRELQLS